MRRLRYAILIIVTLGLVMVPAAVLPEDDMVFCCIRPCTCLPDAKPKCVKKSRIECEREKGEVVADCMLCD
ncbi:MAG: hypothetical protein HY912_11705 [Desulfomonile tiedjei]|uniref:Uncharacterized protein n=1 Tax=Desulfomonile tiedjei TaxID=2358 RepID=A0A9D6V3J6_9BACT|nr:hypothetical protein [Desulfomonile tiedjei]